MLSYTTKHSSQVFIVLKERGAINKSQQKYLNKNKIAMAFSIGVKFSLDI